MPKSLISFYLYCTLAPSKSSLPYIILLALNSLLDHYHFCFISVVKFGHFETQLLQGLHTTTDKLDRLHLMPTCGTQYYRYDGISGNWKQVYAENFTEAEKKKIISTLEEGVEELGYKESKVYGETIEDRGSQVTFSALGQDIVTELGEKGVELKEAWDPDQSKKLKLRNYLAQRLPEFEVRAGGATSIDITKPGIDKAYGMQKLIDMLDISKDDILFLGDRMQEGGNDYPVMAMGIDSLEVSRWEDTALVLEGILHTR